MPSFPLDIYAIGVGKLDVDWKELNELGSKKDGERHAFILQDAKAVQQVFEHMLDVSKLTDTICGVGNMSVNASNQERTPWQVTFKVSGRRGRTWTTEAKPARHSKSGWLSLPCSPRARRLARGHSSLTSGC